MENLWSINIDKEGTIFTPKKLFEEQSEYLRQFTDNKLYLEIKEYTPAYYTFDISGATKSILSGSSTLDLYSPFHNNDEPKMIKKGDDLPDNSKKIQYQVNLRSRVIDHFSFNILTYEHGIEIYPLNISINPDIQIENINQNINNIDENQLKGLVRLIFASDKIQKVVKSLYTLSVNK